MSARTDSLDPDLLRQAIRAGRQHERELREQLAENAREVAGLAHALDRAEGDAVAGCYLRGPGRTVTGTPHPVATVGVLRPGAPRVVRLLAELADGRQLALDLEEEDAWKLQRRLARRLGEAQEPEPALPL